MPVIIQQNETFPHCGAILACGDTLSPPVLQDVIDSVNYLLEFGHPAIPGIDTGALVGGGLAPLGFELPEGHTDFVITLEFLIEENLCFLTGPLRGPYLAGNLAVRFKKPSAPAFDQFVTRYLHTIADYTAVTGVFVPANDPRFIQVGGQLQRWSILGSFDPAIFTGNLNQTFLALLELSLTFPGNQVVFPNTVLSITNPNTGEVYNRGGVYAVHLNTGILP